MHEERPVLLLLGQQFNDQPIWIQISNRLGLVDTDAAMPEGQSWLDVLHRNGLLRYDPSPDATGQDPLAIPDDVVRFSFQRFQDHILAEALLSTVGKPAAALKKGGTLSFVHS